jgi:hypothetical protein
MTLTQALAGGLALLRLAGCATPSARPRPGAAGAHAAVSVFATPLFVP